MSEKETIKETRPRMEAAIDDVRRKLATVRTGRASVSLLDTVIVDYYGTPTPLNQMASVHAPEPQMQDAGTAALAEALRSSFTIVKVVMVLMVLGFFGAGFFTVGPSEKAVILRFGKPVEGAIRSPEVTNAIASVERTMNAYRLLAEQAGTKVNELADGAQTAIAAATT